MHGAMPLIAARAIRRLALLDRAYSALSALRSELVLALASDATLDAYNDLVYGVSPFYRQEGPVVHRGLFRWEAKAVASFFPRPPARVLVGGAGAGREPLALAQMGYSVVAFEAAPALAARMASNAMAMPGVEPYQGRYEELPQLRAAAPGLSSANLEEMPQFDAGMLGWGSFSHIRTQELRIATLAAFARVVRGPLLVSFLALPDTPGACSGSARIRRLLPSRRHRYPGDAFHMHAGFCHYVSERELLTVAAAAGLKPVHVSIYVGPAYQGDDVDYPHAVLMPYLPPDGGESPNGNRSTNAEGGAPPAACA